MTTPTLAELLDVLHEHPAYSSAAELKRAYSLIARVHAMTSHEREVIRAAFLHGPLDDGDVPSKSDRDTLLAEDFVAKVVVKGEDGFNACTYKGAWAYRLIEAGA